MLRRTLAFNRFSRLLLGKQLESQRMILFSVLNALWKMLERRRRVYFVVLAFLLVVAGVLEMLGMLVLFGFIRGLEPNEAGHRRGPIAGLLQFAFGQPLSTHSYAILGGILILLVMAIKHTQGLLVRYQLTRLLSNLHHRIAQQLFGSLAAMPFEDILRFGNLQEFLSSTLEVLRTSFDLATRILADTAIVLMILCLLLFVDVQLTIIGLFLFGVVGFSIYQLLRKQLRKMGRIEHEAGKTVHAALTDTFGGLAEVRIRDAVRLFQRRYSRALGELNRVERKERALSRIPSSANELVLTLAIISSVLYLVLTHKDLHDALHTLGIFGFAGMRANGAMSRINRSYQRLKQKNERFNKRLEQLERLTPRVLGSADVEVPSYLSEEKPLPPGRSARLEREITLRKVTFRYPQSKRPAVRSLSLTIEKGSFVSFCGESGGGKSTIALLIMGLLRPQSGAVLCDDWSVFEHIRAWQRNIGYVGQVPYIARATVRENVAFGVDPSEISDDRVWAALEMASARSFVEQLPGKLDAPLSRTGRLSGGQRQRIVIARALYHDPEIIVFDEATAALDNITEQEITEAALRLRKQKTVICIAHRLSTIEQSDVIHLVEKGRIVASGTYSALLEDNEQFQRLARVKGSHSEDATTAQASER